MALFQVLRGKAAKLLKKKFHDGYVYFTPDDGAIHIDVETDGEQKRMHVNPTAYQQAVAGGFEGTEEEFQKLIAMLPQFETTEHKDIDGINNPDSTEHYPSNKAMADYVNSQILAGKEIFVVNWEQSPEVCQADKTYAEIKAALENDVVTVIGKIKDGGETYATHEITIATDGKIYFRFVWYDETRGTMEKYFWLREDEYGYTIFSKPVSQQDWAENNEYSASYVKNRPGGYTLKTEETMTATYASRPGDVNCNVASAGGASLRNTLIAEFSDDILNAVLNNTLLCTAGESAEELNGMGWTRADTFYYKQIAFESPYGQKIPTIVLATTAGEKFLGYATYDKAGLYVFDRQIGSAPDYSATSVTAVEWPSIKTEDIKIPLKYLEEAPTAGSVDAIGDLYETGILTPAYQNGTFYTAPTGEVYTI